MIAEFVYDEFIRVHIVTCWFHIPIRLSAIGYSRESLGRIKLLNVFKRRYLKLNRIFQKLMYLRESLGN